MAHSKITLIGMYQYLDSVLDDLFSDLVLPTGMDRQTFIDSLMLKGAEFEVLYSDAQTMKYAIGAWSKKWQHTLTKWAEALTLAYNPLDNYDKTETWSDARSTNGKQKGTTSDASIVNGTSEDEESRAAYDSSSYSPLNKNEGKTGSSASSASMTNAETENAESSMHTGHIRGNIGVKSSQSLLLEEWEVAKLNVYDAASDLFLGELTIFTY